MAKRKRSAAAARSTAAAPAGGGRYGNYTVQQLADTIAHCRAVLAAPETKPDHHVRVERKLNELLKEQAARAA